MDSRAQRAQALISACGWRSARRTPLAGDASNRKYERLTLPDGGGSAVLMDANPEKGEDVQPFIDITEHLRNAGLSAPEIFGQDPEAGFLLIEDLGDDLFARVIERDSSLEPLLYQAATDVLLHLHANPAPRLESYNPTLMTDLASLAYTKYADAVGPVEPDNLTRFQNRFEDILVQSVRGKQVLIQRDYHAENLIWLPNREGVARVGLLDYQDAMSGHPAYDLVSLLQDARRDVSAPVELGMTAHYIRASGADEHEFLTAYAVLGVQRNLRILGVFARLSLEYGKPDYVDLIPRVWGHLVRGLEHPVMAPIADLLLAELPQPTEDVLRRLRG
ncbi:aminoglycoside phosphotransferase family protein [Primorskyibacter sp. S87]|uniref:aminoglycoside phosphotransferase family protein n=1 Tax=Primorskyibacter sp. S87 TaxID=3415126 RepID=UPI003C7A1FB6